MFFLRFNTDMKNNLKGEKKRLTDVTDTCTLYMYFDNIIPIKGNNCCVDSISYAVVSLPITRSYVFAASCR